MIDSAAGVSSAAPRPWTAREPMSSPAEGARPVARDAKVNRSRPMRKSRLRSNKSVVRPPSRVSPPVTST